MYLLCLFCFRVKDGRFNERERERSPFRERRSQGDIKSADPRREHFDQQKDNRSFENWSQSSSNTNNTALTSPAKGSWSKESWRQNSERWNNSSRSSNATSNQSFNNSGNVGMPCPPPPGINSYGFNNIRKY